MWLCIGTCYSHCQKGAQLFCFSRQSVMINCIQLYVKWRPYWMGSPSLSCLRIRMSWNLLLPVIFSSWKANLLYHVGCLWNKICMCKEAGDEFNTSQICSGSDWWRNTFFCFRNNKNGTRRKGVSFLGIVVLVGDSTTLCGYWLIGTVLETFSDNNGLI